MSTTRSAVELRKAAVAAGWRGEPLAEEILSKLEELDGANRALADRGAGETPSKTPLVIAIAVAVLGALGASVAGTAYFAAVESSREAIGAKDAQLAAIKADLAGKEAELVALRTQHLNDLQNTAKRMQDIMSAAETTARSSAMAADANQEAVRVFMAEYQSLLARVREASESKDQPAPPGGESPAP